MSRMLSADCSACRYREAWASVPKKKRPDIFAGPPCEACGAATRLLSIEPHRRRRRAHVWTYECTACGEIDKVEMPIPRQPH